MGVEWRGYGGSVAYEVWHNGGHSTRCGSWAELDTLPASMTRMPSGKCDIRVGECLVHSREVPVGMTDHAASGPQVGFCASPAWLTLRLTP